jgi:hypothetical protein
MFPEGNTKISTAGIGKFVVPEGVYRLSEVRVIGGGGGGGQGFNQQEIPRIPSPNPSIVVDYLIVGGGGGGGGYIGGGGGGGGVAIGSTNVSQGSQVSVTVGQGGRGGLTYYQPGITGGNSVFNNITAKGGGGGSSTGTNGGSDLGGNGGTGGSGGGASSFTNTINNNSLKTAGSGTSGQGYPGGTASIVAGSSTENRGYGSGGGGAGGPGSTATTWTAGGAGGPGIASNITGTSRIYGAGGGGASHQTNVNTTGGAGGNFGGGVGSNVLGSAAGAGIDFTGAGGGGAGGLGFKNNGEGGRGGSGVVIVRYQNTKQICTGGDITSYSAEGLTYWVHTFTSTGTFNYVGIDPVLFGGVAATAAPIVPGAGAGGGGGSGSIVSVANVDVMPGEVIEYIVGSGGAGIEPILSTTNPAPSGKPGQLTSFNRGLVAAGGGLGGGGGGPNTGGVGAGNAPNPRVTGAGLVPRTLSYAWSGHMNTYAVWDNYSDASNAWYTFRTFIPSASDTYTFYLSCDNYGVVYLNGPAILSTTSFQSVSATRAYIQKDTINTIGMYAQNWGGPCGYALNVVNSAGQNVFDTRSRMAAETIESLPGAVSRRGGIGQNGTAGIGNGGHGGSNTFGLGGAPGLYTALSTTGNAGGSGRGPGTGGGGGASGIDGQITPASGPGADGEVYIAWGPIVPRDPPQNLIAHFVVDLDEQRMYDRILPYCNPYVMQVSGFFAEKGRNYALFNGTTGNYIGTPADPKYDLVRAANLSFTIEAWVILKGAGSYPYWGGEIINRDAEYEVAITQNDQIVVAIDWGVGSDVNLPGGGWIVPPAGRAIVPRNIPTHVAVVANQSTLLIYINGTLEYTTPLNRVARRDNTPVWIGNRPGQSQAFNGGIADVRIWNVARTQAEIQANMTALVYNTPQGI